MLTGLLGGAVYVNAFTLLSREVQPCLQEFSLAAASLADSVGIALADICGVLIQVCSTHSHTRTCPGKDVYILCHSTVLVLTSGLTSSLQVHMKAFLACRGAFSRPTGSLGLILPANTEPSASMAMLYVINSYCCNHG